MAADARKMHGAFEQPTDELPPDEIKILSGRTLEDIRQNQPEPVIRGGLAVRRNLVVVSSQGGVGKTTAEEQLLVESSLGMPIFGVEDFRPIRPLRGLYINAEDSIRNLNYTLARLLPSYGLDRVPYDEFVVSECGGRFVLDARNARELARRVNGEGYDIVSSDPAISFLPDDFKFIDPGAVRRHLSEGIGYLQRETNAAWRTLHHDNKAGVALSGPADWANFARLALHLEPGDVDGQIALTTIKSNLGYRFKRIVLERDPATGRSTAIELERYGDRAKPGSSADANTVLSKLFVTDIISLPEERRTKDALRAALFAKASPLGIKRTAVREFVDSRVEYADRKPGRTWCKVAVRLIDDDGESA